MSEPNYDDEPVEKPEFPSPEIPFVSTEEPEEPGLEDGETEVYRVKLEGLVVGKSYLEAQMHVFRLLVAANELPVRIYATNVELLADNDGG